MKKYNQKKQSKNLNERRSVRLCLKSIILKVVKKGAYNWAKTRHYFGIRSI